MATINIDNSNVAVNVPASDDAFLGSGAYNDTITLNGSDILHGGLDANPNTINTNGDNTINVINAVINQNGGSVDTINGRGTFDNITINDTLYTGIVSMVYINNSDITLNVPVGYDIGVFSTAYNDTITLTGNNIFHGGLNLNSNTLDVYGDNIINEGGTVTVNGTGGGDEINGKNLYTNIIYTTGSSNDTINGGPGSVIYDSGTGNDVIYAQSLVNEHRITFGSGNDVLVVRDGVSGPQIPNNLDTITVYNFVPGRDVVALNTHVGADMITASNLANITSDTFSYHGLYSELVLGGLSIIFQGVPSLHASDFILV